MLSLLHHMGITQKEEYRKGKYSTTKFSNIVEIQIYWYVQTCIYNYYNQREKNIINVELIIEFFFIKNYH